MPLRLMLVAESGADLLEIAPLLWEARRRSDVDASVVCTSNNLFAHGFSEALDICPVLVQFEMEGTSKAARTANCMRRFEPILVAQKPDFVTVFGDTDSALACSLTSVKQTIAVAHVDGVPSRPTVKHDDLNRVLINAICEHVFAMEAMVESSAEPHNVDRAQVHFVGNLLVDTLIHSAAETITAEVVQQLKPLRSARSLYEKWDGFAAKRMLDILRDGAMAKIDVRRDAGKFRRVPA